MSTLEVSNLNDGTTTVATTYITNGSAKAWLNMKGTGTISVTDSFNVSSIVDNTTGRYATNLTSSMNNIGYAVTGSNISCLSASFAICIQSNEVINTVSKYEVSARNTVSDLIIDTTAANTTVQGDLA